MGKCVPVQITGSIGTTAKKIDGLESGKYVSVYIQNTHASQTLYLSMDGQENYLTITPTTHSFSLSGTCEFPIEVKAEDWRIKGSGLATTFEMVLLKIV